jgi:hypothetical protein
LSSRLLHIYRNSPSGREILLQSIYFCKKVDVKLEVFIPRYPQFLMYFGNKVFTFDLDRTFLRSGNTAENNAEKIIRKAKLEPYFIRLEPEDFTAKSIPNLPTNYDYMCCPRSIRNLSIKIKLGNIGSGVRSIIHHASFPILIPSPVFKKWESITVFFGGSATSLRVMELGLKLSRNSGLPLNIFSQAEHHNLNEYLAILADYPAFKDLKITLEKINGVPYVLCSDPEEYPQQKKISPGFSRRITWFFFEKGKFNENLFNVPHDTLVVAGSYGHRAVKNMIFGSKIEQIQKNLPNNMLVIGANFRLWK